MAVNMQPQLLPPAQTASKSKNETNFVDNMRLPIHRWFRFSAGYSAQWVEGVLAAYGKNQDSQAGPPRVLDPFSGSGTTLLAASSLGSDSVGWESQPFIHRVAQAKVASVGVTAGDLLEAGERVLQNALRDSSKARAPKEEPPLLLKCYEPEALAGLRGIQAAVEKESSKNSKEVADLLWLTLVSILRPVSHVGTAQWQYVLPNKTKAKTVTPFEGFEAKLHMIASDLEEVEALYTGDIALSFQDARDPSGIADNSVDLVITSPPYANNFDYADATRLEMTFLGEVESWSDLKAIRETLIHACSQHMTGYDADAHLSDPLLDSIRSDLEPIYEKLAAVRETKGGKKAYHSMIVGYFYDMARVWVNLRRAVRPGGVAHFVVGDSAPYGVYVPVDEFHGRLAVAAGFDSFDFEKLRDRNIKWKNRKHRVPLKEGVLEVRG